MYLPDIHSHTASANSIFNLYPEAEIPSTYFSVGIHPWYISEPEIQFQLVREKVLHPNCLAIGEFGLDKFSSLDFNLQIKIATKHIQLANEFQKPIIAHVVKAHQEFLFLLKQEKNQMPVIFHGFNQNTEILKAVLKNTNHYISLGNDLLKENSNAQKAIKVVPLGRFFLETDDSSETIYTIISNASELIQLDENKLNFIQQKIFKAVFHAKF